MAKLKGINIIFETDQGNVEYFLHEYGWSLNTNQTLDRRYFGDTMDEITSLDSIQELIKEIYQE